jgi:8-oxo-dGTP diphosphatase
VREAREETSLSVELVRQFHVYSDPGRDPRGHTVSVVFIGRADGEPRGADDAAEARAFLPEELPEELAFDHRQILADYLNDRY